MTIWFTSDTHFGHKRLASIRGFESTIDMDNCIVDTWNAQVKKNDLVYHLGDFSLTGPDKTIEILKSLNGKIYLIRGNHDQIADRKTVTPFFVWIKDVHYFAIQDQKIFLSHYAHRVWRSDYRGSWHLYGHSHGNLPDNLNSKSTDIGWDRWGRLVHFDTIRLFMMDRRFISSDHHGEMTEI